MSTQPNSNAKTNSPRYSNRSQGGRGQTTTKNRSSSAVWTRRTPPPQSTSTDNDVVMSKFGLDSPASMVDSDQQITQKLNNLNIQDANSHRNKQQNSNGSQESTPDKNKKKGKEKKQQQQQHPIQPIQSQIQQQQQQQSNENYNDAEPTSPSDRRGGSRTQRLSLAEFHSSMPPRDDDAANADEEPSRVLWVGNIGPDVTEDELANEFGQYGKIESLRILHNKFCAFVNFEEEEAAKEAKKNLHGTIIGSQYIVIHYRKPELAKQTPSNTTVPEGSFVLNSPSRALWIGNVSEEITEDELRKEFEQFGKIESIRVLRNKTCAFVNFITLEEASNALSALQGKKLGNMAIKINFGKPQTATPKSMNPLDPMNQQYLASMGNPYYPPEYAASGIPGMMPAMPLMMIPQYGVPTVDANGYPVFDQFYEQMAYIPAMAACELCAANLKETYFQPCGHTCCSQCAQKLTRASADKPPKCPWCFQGIQKFVPINYGYMPYTHVPAAPPSVYGVPSGSGMGY